MNKVKVVRQSKDEDGNIIGKYKNNPMLNNEVYYDGFPDGYIRKYGANIGAYNMYSQIDSEGFSHSTLSGILDFSKDTTNVHKGDQYIITKSDQRCTIKSTVGWNLLIA